MRSGDVLTIVIRGNVEVVKVLAPGARRGPPPEARLLYELMSDSNKSIAQPGAADRVRGTGRPTKRERRLTDRLTGQDG